MRASRVVEAVARRLRAERLPDPRRRSSRSGRGSSQTCGSSFGVDSRPGCVEQRSDVVAVSGGVLELRLEAVRRAGARGRRPGRRRRRRGETSRSCGSAPGGVRFFDVDAARRRSPRPRRRGDRRPRRPADPGARGRRLRPLAPQPAAAIDDADSENENDYQSHQAAIIVADASAARPIDAARSSGSPGTGVRPTRQRLLVLETLAAEPHDATAQEIHARLRAPRRAGRARDRLPHAAAAQGARRRRRARTTARRDAATGSAARATTITSSARAATGSKSSRTARSTRWLAQASRVARLSCRPRTRSRSSASAPTARPLKLGASSRPTRARVGPAAASAPARPARAGARTQAEAKAARRDAPTARRW